MTYNQFYYNYYYDIIFSTAAVMIQYKRKNSNYCVFI
jgi:hypothetical protein